MTKPTSTSAEKIVKEIAAKLYVAVPGTDPFEADAEKAAIVLEVRGTIAYLHEIDKKSSPIWGYHAKNTKAWKSLRARIDRVQEALRTMPDAARALLVTLEADETVEEIPNAGIRRKALSRMKHAVTVLAILRARCEHLIAVKPGKDKRAAYRQEWVTDEALKLLRRHNLPTTNNTTGLFREVAMLLYRAMTGEWVKDLERACKEALKRHPNSAPAAAPTVDLSSTAATNLGLVGVSELLGGDDPPLIPGRKTAKNSDFPS